MLEIEDYAEDVVGKAMQGLGLTPGQLARRADVEEQGVQAILEGGKDEDTLRKVARALELSPEALIELSRREWRPEPREVAGMKRFTSKFGGDMLVNAYLAWETGTGEAVVFDTGADASEMIDFLNDKDLKVSAILLTHSHPDHVADLDRLRQAAGHPEAFCPEGESVAGTTSFKPGKTFYCGKLEIRSYLTRGHSPAGTTFVIEGLKSPVAVVGDALFSCSIGGPKVSYEDALAYNRKVIFSLPDPTILCPGHGPVTTVREEKQHNPFFPEFKG